MRSFFRFHTFEKGLALTCVFLLLIAAALYVPAAVYVSAGAGDNMLPIYSVQRNDKKISLTFDAAWGNEDTQAILDILAKYQIRASFFITGGWAESYPDTVSAIASAGHDIGNHSMTHPYMSKLSKEKITAELEGVHRRVKEITGQNMTLFRPPYGDYNNNVIRTAAEAGYYAIQWDVDSEDWRDYGTEAIIKKVTEHKNLGSGSIILMHCGAKYTKDALDMVILSLLDAGYEFVPVSELIYKERWHVDHMGRQSAE